MLDQVFSLHWLRSRASVNLSMLSDIGFVDSGTAGSAPSTVLEHKERKLIVKKAKEEQAMLKSVAKIDTKDQNEIKQDCLSFFGVVLDESLYFERNEF